MSFFGNDADGARETAIAIGNSFKEKLAKQFGVTFIQDHSGEFGEAGAIYLTLRHHDNFLGDCHMTMKVTEIKKGMV